MDRQHIKYQQTNIDDFNDDYDDSNEEDNTDETNQMTAMMSGELVDDLGYDDDDQDTSINAQADHNTPDPPSGAADGDATTGDEPQDETLAEDGNSADADGATRVDMEETIASGRDYLAEAGAHELSSRIERMDEEPDGIEMRDITRPVGNTDDQPGNTDHQDGQESPPPYGEPPSYDEAMAMHQKTRHGKGASSEDLEWDQDDQVTPTRLQDRDVQDADDAMELEDVVVEPGPGDVERGESVADTSFSTPATVDISYQPSAAETSSSSWHPEVKFSDISPRTWTIYGISVLVAIGALLMIILLPLSFPFVEYYQYGMRKWRISEVVEYAKEIYDMGRYPIGPGKTFKRYPAWAHYVDYETIGVFTTDRIILEAHVSFQYFIKQDELGLIEQKYDGAYEETMKSVAEAALKNKGATYSTEEYFAQRGKVEQGLHDAVRLKLGGDCCPNRDECIRLSSCHLCNSNQTLCNKGFHVDVRYFQLKQLFIPKELTEKQLNVQLIYEGNEEEVHRQTYQLIVKDTEQVTEKILNEASVVTNNGTTHANLILKKINATANAIRESAHNEGLQLLYSGLDINKDEHKASLHWLRTLQRHKRLVRGISFKDYVALMQGLNDDD